MKRSSRLKWDSVLGQWQRHDVPFIEVRKFDRTKHLPSVPWIDKDTDQNRYSYYVASNPQRTTARHLAEGIVTGSPEIFAAFALHAFTISEDIPYQIEVGNLAWEVLHRLDPRPGGYWTANSKHIFIGPDGWYIGYREREKADWKEWVDLAASFWTLLATEFAIVRIPELMDFDSEEYQEWREYIEQERQDAERREYERLRAKFEKSEKNT